MMEEKGMSKFNQKMLVSGRGTVIESSGLSHLAVGKTVTIDLESAKKRYEAVFGMECVQIAHDRIMVRDRRAKHIMNQGLRDFFILEVQEVPEIKLPQALANHWGFWVGSPEEVKRIHAELKAKSQEYGFKRLFPITNMHGSYGFYAIDKDENWWEVEYRDHTYECLIGNGDHNTTPEDRAQFPKIEQDLTLASTCDSILGPESHLTHGTTAVRDFDVIRPFYEDVLKFRAVHHALPAGSMAGAGDFILVGVICGDKIQDQVFENRFVVLLDNEASLREMHENIAKADEQYKFDSLSEISKDDFGNSFILRTSDHVWFEFSDRSRESYVKLFN